VIKNAFISKPDELVCDFLCKHWFISEDQRQNDLQVRNNFTATLDTESIPTKAKKYIYYNLKDHQYLVISLFLDKEM